MALVIEVQRVHVEVGILPARRSILQQIGEELQFNCLPLNLFFGMRCPIKNGKIFDMKTTIDAAGRVVVPKTIREQAQLKSGAALEIRWRSGVIEIEPAALPVSLLRRGKFFVAVPEKDIPPLTTAEVRETQRNLRRDRRGE